MTSRTLTSCLAVALLIGCGHERLDLDLPEVGSASDAGVTDLTAGEGASPLRSQAGEAAAVPAGWSPDVFAGTAGQSGPQSSSTDSFAGQSTSAPSDPLFTTDPRGYAAGPDNEPPWCAQGQSFDEVCGNDVDEDCDRTVDELAELGQPCSEGCGQGNYGCDVTTHTVLCRGWLGCESTRSGLCGDGYLDVGEQCDPVAEGEEPGVTCLETCKRPDPQFVPCLDDRGDAIANLCQRELEVCSEHVGACVPVTGPDQRLCPEIPLAGSTDPDAVYPTLEVIETGECWISCGDDADCPPSVLSDCYMGACVVPL